MPLKLLRNKTYRVLVDDTGLILAEKCSLAADFVSRLRGLMFRQTFDDGEALLIAPCNSVHTFFMRFPIDLVFINRDGIAVGVKRNMTPGKMISPISDAWATLELKGGFIESVAGQDDTIEGKTLRFEVAEGI